MELTGFPLWKIEYEGSEAPKISGYLHEAQQFVAEHEVTSITFYVNVMFTTPGQGGFDASLIEGKFPRRRCPTSRRIR